MEFLKFPLVASPFLTWFDAQPPDSLPCPARFYKVTESRQPPSVDEYPADSTARTARPPPAEYFPIVIAYCFHFLALQLSVRRVRDKLHPPPVPSVSGASSPSGA